MGDPSEDRDGNVRFCSDGLFVGDPGLCDGNSRDVHVACLWEILHEDCDGNVRFCSDGLFVGDPGLCDGNSREVQMAYLWVTRDRLMGTADFWRFAWQLDGGEIGG